MLATEIDTHKDVVHRLATEHRIEPSVWIGKENLIPFVQEWFPECLILDKSQLVAGLSDISRDLSVEDLDELASYWDSVEFRDQRINLLEEFNRYPSLDNLRTLDREVLLRHIHSQIFMAMRDRAPNFLFALDTPHNPVNLSAFYIAQWLGIPKLFFSGPGMLVPALIPQTEIGELSFPLELFPEARTDIENKAIQFNIELATKTIDELASEVETDWQSFERERARSHGKTRFHAIKDLKVRVRRELLRTRNSVEAVLSDVIDHSYTELLSAHSGLPVLSDYPQHGLFLLHYQPESAVIPMGFDDSFQANAVIRARQLLPPGIPLLVKEHPSQLNSSMEGGFGRSPRLYELIDSLPNTSAISALSRTESLLRTTHTAFTLIGTIGIEAAIKGIPVVHFGPAWWAGLPGTFDANRTNVMTELLNYSAPPLEDVRRHLLTLIEKTSIPGFADSGTRQYWVSRREFPDGYQIAFISRLVGLIANFAHSLEEL